MEPESNRSAGEGRDLTDQPPYPEIAELAALYNRLRTTKRGTKENIDVQSEIAALKDSLDARADLVHRLKNARDRERLLELALVSRTLEQRFFKEVNALLKVDLTFTELSRLVRFIDDFDEHLDTRLANRLTNSKPTSEQLR